MSDELKPCPFCGGDYFISGTLIRCASPQRCGTWVNINTWRERPLEDKLRAELEQARATYKRDMNDRRMLLDAQCEMTEQARVEKAKPVCEECGETYTPPTWCDGCRGMN